MRPRSHYNLKRLSQISFQNIGRNLLLSLATITMMGLILFIFNVIISLNLLTQSSLNELGKKVDLIIYLDDEASIYAVTEILQDIETIPVVESVTYTSKEEALKNFLGGDQAQSQALELYEIDNPLPANIQIVTQSPDQHELVLDYLDESGYADLLLETESANENQAIVSRLLSVSQFTTQLMIGVTITFILGSLLMIINAIHLSIFTRKKEIQIMQLVGAKPGMIRFPFMFEGAIYSLGAVVLSFVLLYLFLRGTQLDQFPLFQASFSPLKLFLWESLASLSVGLISSTIAISYYLKRTLILDQS